MIHVHDTHPQCTDWSLTENMNKAEWGGHWEKQFSTKTSL